MNVVDKSILEHRPLLIMHAYWRPRSMRLVDNIFVSKLCVKIGQATPLGMDCQRRPQYGHCTTIKNHTDHTSKTRVFIDQSDNPFPTFDPSQDVRSEMFVGI
jgi:hypothetical protein